MRSPVRAIAVLALLIAAPLPAQVDDRAEPVTIKGTVIDVTTGSPVPGVVVTVEGTRRSAFTDTTGAFALTNVEPGIITLIAEQLGYLQMRTTLEARSDLAIRIDVRPNPIVLEGLRVMVDRLETRRRAAGVSVRALEQEDLAVLGSMELLQAIRSRGGINIIPCSGWGGFTDLCVWRRGRPVSARVWIDERPAIAGLDELSMYDTDEIYAVEVYDRRVIRVYTKQYMQYAAVSPPVLPIW